MKNKNKRCKHNSKPRQIDEQNLTMSLKDEANGIYYFQDMLYASFHNGSVHNARPTPSGKDKHSSD
mgnify:CR=1